MFTPTVQVGYKFPALAVVSRCTVVDTRKRKRPVFRHVRFDRVAEVAMQERRKYRLIPTANDSQTSLSSAYSRMGRQRDLFQGRG